MSVTRPLSLILSVHLGLALAACGGEAGGGGGGIDRENRASARGGEQSATEEAPMTASESEEETDPDESEVPVGNAGTAVGYVPLNPFRLLDSRNGSGLAPAAFTGSLSPNVERTISLAGLDGVLGDAASRAGIAMNVVATETAQPGYLRVYPCGAEEKVALINFGTNESVAGFAVLGVTDRFCIRASTTTKVVIDVSGTFQKGRGALFSPASRRLYDSRVGAKGKSYTVSVPGLDAKTGGVLAHLTITQPDGAGYATIFPCGDRPPTSTINFGAGDTIATTALVQVDAQDKVCVETSIAAHVVVDLEGTFGDGKLGFIARAPARVLDSRGAAAKTTFRVKVPNVPAGAQLAAVHLTAVEATAPAVAQAHPCSANPGATSAVNIMPGKARTSLTFLPIDANGESCVTASSAMHLIADVAGVLAP